MQSTVINTYLFNYLVIFIIFHYFPLFHIIFHYFHYHFTVKSATHSVVTLLWSSEMHIPFIHSSFFIQILVLLVSFLWGPQTVWFVILHLECSTQNFGGVCVTQWDWGHLMSPLFTSNTFYFSVNNSSLYLFKLLIIVL